MKQELTDLLNAPVVFAHNDLLSGNLMFNDEEGVYDPPFPVHMLLSLFC
jgi:thiamine kinase-like enzyme